MANERVIVAGAGGISNAWFPPIKTEGLKVVAVVDLKKASAEEKIVKHELAGAAAEDDLDRALRDHKADFLIDLTIPQSHCEVTCKALRAGLHVIGEKPMANSMDEARKMVQASRDTGKLYMVSQSRRWDVKHETISQLITSGGLGTLTTLNCDFFLGAHFGGFRDEMESPLILDMSIHHFDLARMFAKRKPLSVYAEEFNPHGSWYKGDVAGNCLFEFEDNVRFAYRGSWCAEGCHTSWNGDWRVIGDHGTLIYAADKDPHAEIVTGTKGFMRTKSSLTVTPATVEATGMHGGLREMLAFLRTGQRPQTECTDNIHSLAMVFAAMHSARTGRRVKIRDV